MPPTPGARRTQYLASQALEDFLQRQYPELARGFLALPPLSRIVSLASAVTDVASVGLPAATSPVETAVDGWIWLPVPVELVPSLVSPEVFRDTCWRPWLESEYRWMAKRLADRTSAVAAYPAGRTWAKAPANAILYFPDVKMRDAPLTYQGWPAVRLPVRPDLLPGAVTGQPGLECGPGPSTIEAELEQIAAAWQPPAEEQYQPPLTPAEEAFVSPPADPVPAKLEQVEVALEGLRAEARKPLPPPPVLEWETAIDDRGNTYYRAESALADDDAPMQYRVSQALRDNQVLWQVQLAPAHLGSLLAGGTSPLAGTHTGQLAWCESCERKILASENADRQLLEDMECRPDLRSKLRELGTWLAAEGRYVLAAAVLVAAKKELDG